MASYSSMITPNAKRWSESFTFRFGAAIWWDKTLRKRLNIKVNSLRPGEPSEGKNDESKK